MYNYIFTVITGKIYNQIYNSVKDTTAIQVVANYTTPILCLRTMYVCNVYYYLYSVEFTLW